MENKESKTLKMHEFLKILSVISKYHTYKSKTYKNIENKNIIYIVPVLDTRTKDIFKVTFNNIEFDYRDSEESLYKRICNYLQWDAYMEIEKG